MNQYQLTPDADSDLVEIWLSISAEAVDAADRVLKALTDTFKLLAKNPKMGRVRADLSPRLRSFPKGSYVIFYRIATADNDVEIMRIVHSSRNIEAILSEP